jgi:hypothetical protein
MKKLTPFELHYLIENNSAGNVKEVYNYISEDELGINYPYNFLYCNYGLHKKMTKKEFKKIDREQRRYIWTLLNIK